MQIEKNDILNFAKYFTKIAHTRGRLRIRVSPKIREISGISEAELKAKIASISGIKEYKFNPLIGSLTIFYDSEIFNPQLWEEFLSGQVSPELISLVNSTANDICS
ncbi:MAG: hypothetical protein J6M14_08040 [Campylobacter sp.]|nr:hypothetical protein [Campylobacter sp.]